VSPHGDPHIIPELRAARNHTDSISDPGPHPE
jgi:hypothetical protein